MIEVLFVMIIIGILCAIAIPMYLGQRDRAKNAAAVEGGRTIMIAVLTHAAKQDGDDTWPATADKALLVGGGRHRGRRVAAGPVRRRRRHAARGRPRRHDAGAVSVP